LQPILEKNEAGNAACKGLFFGTIHAESILGNLAHGPEMGSVPDSTKIPAG
jgi:hypothetical protein